MTIKAFGALRLPVAHMVGESIAESWRPTEAIEHGGALTPTNRSSQYAKYSAQRKAFAISVLSAMIGVLSCGVLRAQLQARQVLATPLTPSAARTSAPPPTDVIAETTSGSAVVEAPINFESTTPSPAVQSKPPGKERPSAREHLRADTARVALTPPLMPPVTTETTTPRALAVAEPVREAPKEAAPVEATKKPDAASLEAQTVTVVMQVENGHVAQAAVAASRPGMEAYEASALRIARQRRFPAGTIGKQTMLIKVTRQ